MYLLQTLEIADYIYLKKSYYILYYYYSLSNIYSTLSNIFIIMERNLDVLISCWDKIGLWIFWLSVALCVWCLVWGDLTCSKTKLEISSMSYSVMDRHYLMVCGWDCLGVSNLDLFVSLLLLPRHNSPHYKVKNILQAVTTSAWDCVGTFLVRDSLMRTATLVMV